MIPVEVMQSEAFITLPNYAVRVLLVAAAQYRGNNNGDIAVTRSIAAPYGVTSHEHLVKGLAHLLARLLLQKTRQGGKKPLGPTLYALTWRPINDLGTKIDIGPTVIASNAWAKWIATVATPSSTKNHQACPRATSGLPAGQTEATSGLPADQSITEIRPAGRSPSISRPWAPDLAVPADRVQ